MKYVAELAHVREVSLLGSADLGFWAERLRVEGLTPVEHAGRARVLVVACDSKFFGVRFRELSFSVFVRRPDASEGSDAAFLVQAFRSSPAQDWFDGDAPTPFLLPRKPFYEGVSRVLGNMLSYPREA